MRSAVPPAATEIHNECAEGISCVQREHSFNKIPPPSEHVMSKPSQTKKEPRRRHISLGSLLKANCKPKQIPNLDSSHHLSKTITEVHLPFLPLGGRRHEPGALLLPASAAGRPPPAAEILLHSFVWKQWEDF